MNAWNKFINDFTILPHPYLEKNSPAFLFPSEFFKKVGGGKNEQTKVYDHGGQATRGQKVSTAVQYLLALISTMVGCLTSL